MTLTLKEIRQAIAGVIRRKYPDYEVYGSPNQQGTSLPCFFVFFMPGSKADDQLGGAAMREIGVDIVFQQERNMLNAYQAAEEAADYLDAALRYIPYGELCLHVHEREWEIEDELHYKFKIKERIRQEGRDPELGRIESYHGGVK